MGSSKSLSHSQHVRAAKSSGSTSIPCSSPLIPGIQDDVVFYHILTKVPWKCYFVLPAVNRRWREEFRSRRVYEHRRSIGTDQQLIAVIHSIDSDRLTESVLSLFTLADKNEWLHLPRIPGVPEGFPRGCGLVFLDGILYVIGGCDFHKDRKCLHNRKSVYELDVGAGQGVWRAGMPMKMEKSDFLCKVEEGRIHMAKFNDAICINHRWQTPRWEMDVYDSVSKSWTQSFHLCQPTASAFGSIDKELFCGNSIWDLSYLGQNYWGVDLEKQLLVRNTMARVNGSLYSVSAAGVSIRDKFSGEWNLHSVSFRDYVRTLGPDDEIQCWNVVPLGGELVVTVSWRRRSLSHSAERWYHYPADFIFALVVSSGLSSGGQSVAWNKIQFPERLSGCTSFPSEGCNERNGSFPVFFGLYAPQVYPCKL